MSSFKTQEHHIRKVIVCHVEENKPDYQMMLNEDCEQCICDMTKTHAGQETNWFFFKLEEGGSRKLWSVMLRMQKIFPL